MVRVHACVHAWMGPPGVERRTWQVERLRHDGGLRVGASGACGGLRLSPATPLTSHYVVRVSTVFTCLSRTARTGARQHCRRGESAVRRGSRRAARGGQAARRARRAPVQGIGGLAVKGKGGAGLGRFVKNCGGRACIGTWDPKETRTGTRRDELCRGASELPRA